MSSILTRTAGSAAALALASMLAAACGSSDSGDPATTGGSAPSPISTAPQSVSQSPPEAPTAPTPAAPVAVKTEEVTARLTQPWSLAFLPDGSMLVAEKAGTIRRVTPAGAVSASISGVPAVRTLGQGGLLDLVPSPDFVNDGTIFFTYSEPVGADESRTAVARAQLGDTALSDVTVIYRQTPSWGSGVHFGSRLVFDGAGHLHVTLGDRGLQDQAQQLTSTMGKVVRIRPDGTIPADNPAFGGAVPGIWSYGHRNPQGAALNPATGELWLSEHGPRGGDEINRIKPGANYGWPRVTYGRSYDTAEPLGEGTTAPDVEPPVHYWVPVSVAPAGMSFYTGDKLPGWQGSLVVGTLAGKMLARLTLQGDTVVAETRHLVSDSERIRDVRQGPDGFLYLLTDSGRLLRVVRQ